MTTETGSSRYKFTREELLGSTNITAREWQLIDPERWYDDIEAPDDEVDATAATMYIARAIADYTDRPTADDELIGEFCQDFEGWTRAMFKRVPTTEEFPQWPDELFERIVFDKRSAAYMLQQRLIDGQHAAGRPSRARDQTSATAREQTRSRDQSSQRPEQEQRITSQPRDTVEHDTVERNPRPDQQRQQTQQPPSTYNNFDRFREYTPAYPQRPKGTSRLPPIKPSGETDPYKAVPLIDVGNEKLNATTINAFVKMWDRDKKYTGKLYDLLDDKLKIFYSICYHADIGPGQFHAVFPRILDGRAEEYYLHFVDQRMDTFLTAYTKLKNHFDTDVNHGHYYTDWTTTLFVKVQRENPDKSLHEVLDIMLDKLQLCQRALGQQYIGEYALRTTVITACRGVKELEMALYKPPLECEALFGDLRSSIENSLAMTVSVNFTEADPEDQYYLDRRYSNTSSGRLRGGRGRSNRGYGKFPRGRGGLQQRSESNPQTTRSDKKCYICGKTGWEQMEYAVFLVAYEGEEVDQFFQEEEDNQRLAVKYLTNQAFLHHVTGEDVYRYTEPTTPATQFLIKDRYSRITYQGILPDTGASNVSTAGKEQFLALQSKDPTVTLDTSTSGNASVQFGKGSVTTSIGTAHVSTEVGKIKFNVLDAPTPFLLCLKDMDRLNVYFNNTTDQLVQGKATFPVIRKWGHPWFYLSRSERARVFLTETELQRLHRRFGHPAVERLIRLLKQAGHDDDMDEQTLREIQKLCHHCQAHDPAPRRFKFSLKDD
ncbi:hypothetical protein EJ02DRAFT_438705 [Clathrospora elynae]|uniref:GAG-pre-integrase domain-containing protein n=1 Tax=Clathrospora elynae TaxID=706981 RepID=A0A6A5SCK4_9PLEO|nr:hypothetical protein EJ02DRAFT_438705 [Clathrospora elynae]